MWFQKISIPYPPQKGLDFPGGEGESICLIFQWGRGVTIGKYFQRVLVTRKRVITKKKHKTLPRQFICEDIKHNESGLNGHNKHILSVPWRDLSCENVPYGLLFSNRFGIRLNSSGCPFKTSTTWAIHLKKVVIRLNGLGYPFEKEFVDRSSYRSYLFTDKF